MLDNLPKEKWSEKYLNTMKRSTIETEYDKYGNKISIFESFKEVDKEKTIKEHITSL